MSKSIIKKSLINSKEESSLTPTRKLYIEFVLEGLIVAEENEAKTIEAKLSSIFNKILKDHRSVRINNQVAKYYEDELMLSIFQQRGLDQYEH